MWYHGLRLNIIDIILILIRCILFFRNLSRKNLWIKHVWPKKNLRIGDWPVSLLGDAWVRIKCRKDLYWSVGMMCDPKRLPGVSTVGPRADGVLHHNFLVNYKLDSIKLKFNSNRKPRIRHINSYFYAVLFKTKSMVIIHSHVNFGLFLPLFSLLWLL